MIRVTDLYEPANELQGRWALAVKRAVATGDSAAAVEACQRLAAGLKAEPQPGADGKPYLTRYLLAELPGDGRLRVYLHHYTATDTRAPHNSPWDSSLELVIAGSITVHVHGEGAKRYEPGQQCPIAQADFRRVELHGEDAWTVLRTGAPVSSWGFLDEKTGKAIPPSQLGKTKDRPTTR